MKHLLSGTVFVTALALTAPGFAAAPFAPQPLGGPYMPETAPSPPSTVYETPYYGYYGWRAYGYGRPYYPYGGGYYR